ncbi:hypothetical protein BATDEDRAFT_26730 [Batrachochytrium dendrobatidis JAM81]|uniref:Ras-GEF domain-containing protein n=1 Tax=Batrachochytrium dendrobatidis (strain JAM81 / FGSC 10211) TaxID=684364 RepID=F4P8B0_BATDJ|nr:uncharacterized protein BATDEDRAFT_26730 [Batrachochytrium dendrobatidis JAM81]EGF78583.1 hypothetical protein BATDEDRAFT_26730 [Batrachochytrium dendrobatidis JAM81]|eukprot:XP_006680746.1 hypothetical protein BATDEDRAFT_26730 [Batrachochytrium dendrobatidis JAM81]
MNDNQVKQDEHQKLLMMQADEARKTGNIHISFRHHIQLAGQVLARLEERTDRLYETGTSQQQTLTLMNNLDSQIAEIYKDLQLAVSTPESTASKDCRSGFTTDMLVPMLPLSPLTKRLALSAQLYHHADSQYKQSVAPSSATILPPAPLASVRRMLEDVNIGRDKLQQLQSLMDSVATVPITAFSPATLSLHMAFISVELFSKIPIFLELQSVAGPESVKEFTRRSMDWHQYICHLAISAIVLSTPESIFGNQTRSNSGHTLPPTADHARAAAIETIVTTMCYSTYVYRDLETATALLEALQSKPILCLKSSWALLKKQVMDQYMHMSDLLHHDGLMELTTEIVISHQQRSGIHAIDGNSSANNVSVIVVPCMHYLVENLIEIRNEFGTDSSAMPKLSHIGSQRLENMINLANACQSNSLYLNLQQPSLLVKDTLTATGVTGSASSAVYKMDLSMPSAPVFLSGICASNETLLHWLLTRVYHDMSALDAQSRRCCSDPTDFDHRGGGQSPTLWTQIAYAHQQLAKMKQQHCIAENEQRNARLQSQNQKKNDSASSINADWTKPNHELNVDAKENQVVDEVDHAARIASMLDNLPHSMTTTEQTSNAFDSSLLDRFSKLGKK